MTTTYHNEHLPDRAAVLAMHQKNTTASSSSGSR